MNKIKNTVSKNNKKQEREGQTFLNNEGCLFFIKEYRRATYVIVKFKDEYGAEVKTTYQNCTKGEVKNPFFKMAYGVGFLGLHSDGSKPVVKIKGKLAREYMIWRQMLRRVYSGDYPTYENVTVCERWHSYALFCEDLPYIENYQYWLENPNQHISLDKDIKQKGIENKIYSIETVKFVSASENTSEMLERRWHKDEIEEVKEDLVLGYVA